MRLKSKLSPKLGDTKIKVRFLLFPLTLGAKRRWLEFAKIKYEYKEEMISYDMGGQTVNRWSPIEFLPYDPVKDCEIYKTTGCAHVDGMLCDIEACALIEKNKKL